MVREYHAPSTVQEAVVLKERLAESAVFLAGGTEVNAAATPAPEHVISLERLNLTGIRLTEAELTIGACCTIQQVIDSEEVPEIVKTAGRHIFNRNIRNMATVGGQVGSNRSCGNLLPILVAIEAVVEIITVEGRREMPVLQYLTEERRELIAQIRIRRAALSRPAAVERYCRTANDLSILTAAVCLTREDRAIVDPAIAVGGVAKHVMRLEAVERALHGKPPPSREAIERLAAGCVSPIDDIRGSAEFKRHMAGVLVAKGVVRAYREEAGGIPRRPPATAGKLGADATASGGDATREWGASQ